MSQTELQPKRTNSPKLAGWLKVSAIAVAAPRYSMAFLASVGVIIPHTTKLGGWMTGLEGVSGFAMAILEGLSFYFVLSRMSQLDPTGNQYRVLARFAWLLGLITPLVALPHLLAYQNAMTIKALFTGLIWGLMWQILWSFTIAAVPVVIVMAVGYAEQDSHVAELAGLERAAEIKQAQQNIRLEQRNQKLEQANEGANPFACDGCDRRFRSHQALNGHQGHCKANGAQELVTNANGNQEATP
ncbi:MAG: hypothetical protein V3R81_15375 [Gammaproteobacteria bacterium]